LPKLMLAGLMPMAGATPVPDKVKVCGLPVALSLMVSEAERLPVAAGVKVTFTVVLLPGVIVIGGVAAVKANSLAFVPVIARLVIIRLAVPPLLMVRIVGALVVPTA